jgi:hypothetical protein
MDVLIILRTFAALTTVLAAALVAANLNARVTVIGFVIFIAACIVWTIDGWIEGKASLVIQNVILLFINVIGVWRWYHKGREGSEGLAIMQSSRKIRRGGAPFAIARGALEGVLTSKLRLERARRSIFIGGGGTGGSWKGQ